MITQETIERIDNRVQRLHDMIESGCTEFQIYSALYNTERTMEKDLTVRLKGYYPDIKTYKTAVLKMRNREFIQTLLFFMEDKAEITIETGMLREKMRKVLDYRHRNLSEDDILTLQYQQLWFYDNQAFGHRLARAKKELESNGISFTEISYTDKRIIKVYWNKERLKEG